MLNIELDEHLDSPQQKAAGNHRNGNGRKTVTMDDTTVEHSIARDRNGKFEPQLIDRYRRRFPGFDESIVAMSAEHA